MEREVRGERNTKRGREKKREREEKGKRERLTLSPEYHVFTHTTCLQGSGGHVSNSKSQGFSLICEKGVRC